MQNDTDTIKAMDESQPKKRPTMNDPAEFAIVRRAYLEKDGGFDQATVSENIERAHTRRKITATNSR